MATQPRARAHVLAYVRAHARARVHVLARARACKCAAACARERVRECAHAGVRAGMHIQTHTCVVRAGIHARPRAPDEVCRFERCGLSRGIRGISGRHLTGVVCPVRLSEQVTVRIPLQPRIDSALRGMKCFRLAASTTAVLRFEPRQLLLEARPLGRKRELASSRSCESVVSGNECWVVWQPDPSVTGDFVCHPRASPALPRFSLPSARGHSLVNETAPETNETA